MKPIFSLLPALLFISPFNNLTIEKSRTTTVSDILTQSVWTSFESWKDEDGDGVFELMKEDCKADNDWQFNPDGTFLLSEDAEICEPDMPEYDTLSCNWELRNGDSVLGLVFLDSEDEVEFVINSIGENELILHVIDSEYPNDPLLEKIILKR